MTFYERIESLRKSKGLSQGKLEKELGFSNGSVSKWKNSMPTIERIQKLSEYFGVSVEYLTTGEEKEGGEKYYLNDETAQVAQEIFENRELRALFDVQKDMEPDDLRALHNMALALKRKERGYDDGTGC